ncbi:ATPase AAA domain-containing protein 5 [Dermatophagoides pteronyssinus]|uniref:ATPase AAA domain-containing protein 5 n=1 Tax=Dermatophagoides pteronyssinus TaxID=6956 RepID=A0ABQ8J633_DERPT|nr:ATPase AAA domain-containing protein 5 [Dermatophagoides pteronyssinus]
MSSNKITDYFGKRSNVSYKKNENDHLSKRKNVKKATKVIIFDNNNDDDDDSATEIDDDLTEFENYSTSTELWDEENDITIVKTKRKKKKQQVVQKLKQKNQKSRSKIVDKINKNKIITIDDSIIESTIINDINILTHKYQPKTIDNMIGQTNEINIMKNWLENWNIKFNNDDNKYEDDDLVDDVYYGKCLYIFGSNGIGKTAMVYAVAKDCGYNILEYNATIKHLTPKSLQNELYESSQSYLIDNSTWQTKKHEQMTTGFSKSLILLDDIDAIVYENKSLNELWRSLRTIIQNSRKPIIITSNLEPSFLCNEQSFFRIIQLRPIRFESIIERLDTIFQIESINKFEHHCNNNHDILFETNDVRKMINQLDFWYTGKQIHNVHDHNSESSHLKTYYQHYINQIFMKTKKSLDKQSRILETLSNDDLYQTELNRFLNINDEMDENRYNIYSIDKRYTLIIDNDDIDNIITIKEFNHLLLYKCDHNFIRQQMTTDLIFESLQMLYDYFKYNDLFDCYSTKFDYLSLFEFVIESFPELFSSNPLQTIVDQHSNRYKHRTRSSQKQRHRLQYVQIEYNTN